MRPGFDLTVAARQGISFWSLNVGLLPAQLRSGPDLINGRCTTPPIQNCRSWSNHTNPIGKACIVYCLSLECASFFEKKSEIRFVTGTFFVCLAADLLPELFVLASTLFICLIDFVNGLDLPNCRCATVSFFVWGMDMK